MVCRATEVINISGYIVKNVCWYSCVCVDVRLRWGMHVTVRHSNILCGDMMYLWLVWVYVVCDTSTYMSVLSHKVCQQIPCFAGCINGFYGTTCSNPCGNCKDGVPCDKTTGNCPQCRGNYQLPLCIGRSICDVVNVVICWCHVRLHIASSQAVAHLTAAMALVRTSDSNSLFSWSVRVVYSDCRYSEGYV